jgi:DNA-3-methyladenine glycosylase
VSSAVHEQLHGEPRPLDRDRLARCAPDAARDLLGAIVIRHLDGQRVLARVVETEAYREDDPASHSHAGRSARSEPMFRRPGTCYVYRSYGIHWCWNVSVEQPDVGAAVLIRAVRVLEGIEAVRARRPDGARDVDLLRGPGRLTAGLDIDGPRHDRGDLIDGVAGLALGEDAWWPEPGRVVAGPRVGVSRGADLPWRFHLDGVREVSPYRRSPRAPRPAS